LNEEKSGRSETPTHEQGAKTRALVLGPYPSRPSRDMSVRDPKARLAEAVGLANAIDLELVGEIGVSLNEVRPATYLGKGKVEEIGEIVKEREVALVAISKRPGTPRSSTAPG